jgi:alcohol dehydrogenase class IV
LVTYGGGSALGLAKSIALEFDIPIIAIVTTYSGSETTELQGMFENGKRVLKRSHRMQPKTIIYDPELSLDLPLEISLPSAVNSMAQAVGSFMGENPNPVTSLFAEEGLRSMKNALPRIIDNPKDVEARGDALYGSWLCGSTLNSSGTVFHHKVCHVLGGYFKLPHAKTHTIILPHSTGYNRDFLPDAMSRIARAFGDDEGDAAGAIFDLLMEIEAPSALKDIGMSENDLDEAAKLITTDPYFSPRPVEYAPVRSLLDDAWHGRRPSIN